MTQPGTNQNEKLILYATWLKPKREANSIPNTASTQARSKFYTQTSSKQARSKFYTHPSLNPNEKQILYVGGRQGAPGAARSRPGPPGVARGRQGPQVTATGRRGPGAARRGAASGRQGRWGSPNTPRGRQGPQVAARDARGRKWPPERPVATKCTLTSDPIDKNNGFEANLPK